MTERLADIGARITGVRQLGSVMNAMRGIAASRAQQARNQLPAVDAYAAIIAAAIGHTLALLPPGLAQAEGPTTVVVFTAEQGFAGGFSERVLNAVSDMAGGALVLIGTRGRVVAVERGLHPAWTAAMPSHPGGVPRLADLVAEALIARTGGAGVEMLYTDWKPSGGLEIIRETVLPFDPARFPAPRNRYPPLLNLPPATLLAGLTTEYLHGQICRAALHAYAAENEARMEAMAAAHTQVERQLSSLESTRRLVRQEEITAEIIELAAGESASRSRGGL